LIVGAAFYFIYNQLANSDARLGEVHYFIQEESVGSGIIFILLLSVLNHFLEILKWQNLVSFYIKSPEATKQVLAALTAGLFSNGIGNTQVKPCSLINQLPKKCCF
jgi:hypothetical protein